MSDYLKTADVWTVLDLIVAEFKSDPMSVQCFDLRLVERALELNKGHQRGPILEKYVADENAEAHRTLDQLGVAAVRDGRTLGLRQRILDFAARVTAGG